MSTTANDLGLYRERSRAFYGHVKVPIQHLWSEVGFEIGTRPLDSKNIARLKKVYELEGCLRLEPEHYVPALINKSTLTVALEQSNLSLPALRNQLRDLSEPPLLKLASETRLLCLHGKHRLEAAKEFLVLADRWWVVDLYDEDLEEPSKATLREEYSNSKSFGDGEIYRYLRHHQLNGNITGAHKWMARLSKSKRLDVEKLQKMALKSQVMANFQRSLDDLLPFIGLWSALQIGTFHRLLTLKCPEEMTSYLRLTHRTWTQVVDGDLSIASQVDSTTVELMQGKILAYSTEDLNTLDQDFKRFSLFPTLRNPSDRLRVWRGICSIRHRIPSIFTFLEDTKYLEPCAKIVKTLLPADFCSDSNGSVQAAFLQRHSGTEYPELELSKEGCFSSEYAYLPEKSAKIAYRQLWLFAMRHFPNLTGVQPRKDPGRPKPSIQGSAPYWWGILGQLAAHGGFRSAEISRLLIGPGMITDMNMAVEFLKRVRPTDTYFHDDEALRVKAETICQLLQDIVPLTGRPPKAVFTLNSGVPLGIAERCGRPFERSYSMDKPYLFLDTIYASRSRDLPCANATSIAIKRDTFRAFFWAPHNDSNFSDDFDYVNYVGDNMIVDTAAGNLLGEWGTTDADSAMGGAGADWLGEVFPNVVPTDAMERVQEVSTALVPGTTSDWLLDTQILLPADVDAEIALRQFYELSQPKPFLIYDGKDRQMVVTHNPRWWEGRFIHPALTFDDHGIAKGTPSVDLTDAASRNGGIILHDAMGFSLTRQPVPSFSLSRIAQLLSTELWSYGGIEYPSRHLQ